MTPVAFPTKSPDVSCVIDSWTGNPGLLIIAKRSDDVEDVYSFNHTLYIGHKRGSYAAPFWFDSGKFLHLFVYPDPETFAQLIQFYCCSFFRFFCLKFSLV